MPAPTPPAANQPPSSRPFVPSIRISSPATGNTVPQAFTAAGLYDLGGGTFDKVECQLMNGGAAVDPAIAGKLIGGRPVWTTDMTTTKTGTYDLTARLYLTSGEIAEQTVAGIIIEAAPMITLDRPAPGFQSGDGTVGVTVSFAPGHTISRIDVNFVDAGNNWESQTNAKIAPTDTGRGPMSMTGFASEDHRVQVTARNSSGPPITVSAGAILL